jgi:hypothetical protein
MTHARPEEIHDHAYGFRPSEHVASCADCRRAADAVAAERGSLKDALREGPREIPADFLARLESVRASRRRIGAPALAAAALLLGALLWILSQPKIPVVPPSPPSATPTYEEDLEMLLKQLRSPSPLNQELARMAFRKYAGVAIPVLERAHADPVLIDECRGFNDADREAYRKAQTTKLTFRAESSLTEAIEVLRNAGGLNLHIAGVPNPDEIRVTLALKDASMVEVLDQLSLATKLPWGRSTGLIPEKLYRADPPSYQPVFLFGMSTRDPLTAVPIRVRSLRAWAAEQARLAPESRTEEQTAHLFRRLARAADPSLWSYLDSPRPEVRRLAERTLRDLYAPPSPPPQTARDLELDRSRITAVFEEKPVREILLDLGTTIVLDPRVELPGTGITFKVKDLPLKNVLKLLSVQNSLELFIENDWVLMTKPEWLPFRRGPGPGLWASPEEALQAEEAIDGLASPDPARRERGTTIAREAGRRGLEWLDHASLAGDPSQIRPYTDGIRQILSDLGIRYADAPGATAEQSLTPAQKAILERKLVLKSPGRTLAQLLQDHGIKARLESTPTTPLLVVSPGMSVESLLRAVTAPLGLGFSMDGDTVVIDTAEKAWKAVEKK